VRAARARGVRPDGVRNPTFHPGLGVTAVSSSGEDLCVGNRALVMEQGISIAAAEQRIAQHGEESPRGGDFDRRVERRNAERTPKVVADGAVLSVSAEELDDRHLFLQMPHRLDEPHGSEALGERDAASEQQAAEQIERGRQPEGAEGELLRVAQLEGQAQHRVLGHADGVHEAEQLAVGADKGVLAVVELGALRDDAPGTAARGLRRLENRDRDLALCERHGRRHAGVAGPHDRYPATHVFQAIQNLRSGVSDVRRSRTLKPSRSISASSAR